MSNYICSSCGQELISNNNWRKASLNKGLYKCNYCVNNKISINTKYQVINKEISRLKRFVCNDCGEKLTYKQNGNDIKQSRYLCKACKRIRTQEYEIKRRFERRTKLFDIYNHKCACCGITDYEFLTLDHVNNDGHIERKILKSMTIYKNIIESKSIRNNYQILCMNCNGSKGHNGFCPHIFSEQNKLCHFCRNPLNTLELFEFNNIFNHPACKFCVFEMVTKLNKGKSKNMRDALYKKNYYLNLKMSLINGYGGICECCGEHEAYFLTIDHINGGGRKETKTLKKIGSSFYKYLIDNGYPKDNYRLLCYNCNCSRGYYGYCPHEK